MKAKVTFEYPLRAPDTLVLPHLAEGTTSAVASRAIRFAKKKIRPRQWSSMVLLLEREEGEENAKV